MSDEQRNALATRDYYESCGAMRALRLLCAGLSGLPRTREAVRAELRFWLAAARRAKQVMRSTTCPH